MKNEPVAWWTGEFNDEADDFMFDSTKQKHINHVNSRTHEFFPIPLYTQDQLEEARKLGMQQERAMWNLSASSQEIMDTHPVKEFFEDEPQAEELHEIMQSNTELTDSEIQEISHRYHYTYNPDYIGFARAIMKRCGIISGTDK